MSSAIQPSTPSPVSKQPNSVNADALLRSLEPVVAKPDATRAMATPPRPVQREVAPPPSDDAPATPPATPPARETATSESARRPARRAAASGARAKMDVAINPGEGSSALYVRVPRTTHVALKLLALQNQASLEGPQDLATIVRTAIDEYLERSHATVRAAG